MIGRRRGRFSRWSIAKVIPVAALGSALLSLSLLLSSSLRRSAAGKECDLPTAPAHAAIPVPGGGGGGSGGANLDPFPLPPCSRDKLSAVYAVYGGDADYIDFQLDNLLRSVRSLRRSRWPGTVRVVLDEAAASRAREALGARQYGLVDDWRREPSLLPDVHGREVIPHSNKIRALRAGALVHGTDDAECALVLDTDTHARPDTPWEELLSALELNDVAVAKDCDVRILGGDVPLYLSWWMPNTGVMALRNTPRTRRVLSDWLGHYRPCNATSVASCTPGTDQNSFAMLLVRHAARVERLHRKWNCRCDDTAFRNHPVYVLTVLSDEADVGSKSEVMTCGGFELCHILHGHYLSYE